MQSDLCLAPLVEGIYFNVTRLTVKCRHFLHISPQYSQLIWNDLVPNSRLPAVLLTERTLIRSVTSVLRSLKLDVRVANVYPVPPPPWLPPLPEVSYTPTCKSDLPALQL